MGRPLKQIDPKQVEQLAAMNCSYAEIAAVVGVTPKTLRTRFYTVIEEGRERGKASLKRQLWKSAMNGRDSVLIFMAKNMLGYADKVETQHSGTISQPLITEVTVHKATLETPDTTD